MLVLSLETVNAEWHRGFAFRANNTVNFESFGQCVKIEDRTIKSYSHIYRRTATSVNGDLQENTGVGANFNPGYNNIGINPDSRYLFSGSIYSIRLYEKDLASTEIAANYEVDKARFGLA